MLCEKILGKLKDFDLTGKTVEYVDIEWHEAFKKIHRKTTDSGREVGIRLDDSVLTRGLFQDDVIYADEKLVIAVNTPPCEVIEVSLEPGHEKYVAKVCYEIGNRHAPLFWGDQENTFITIYNEPMMVMLEKLHGVKAEKKTPVREQGTRPGISSGAYGKSDEENRLINNLFGDDEPDKKKDRKKKEKQPKEKATKEKGAGLFGFLKGKKKEEEEPEHLLAGFKKAAEPEKVQSTPKWESVPTPAPVSDPAGGENTVEAYRSYVQEEDGDDSTAIAGDGELDDNRVIRLRLEDCAGCTCPKFIEIDLRKGHATIGRMDKNGEPCSDYNFDAAVSFVSRRHFRIEPSGNEWQIIDIGSSNGTIVSGENLTPNMPHTLKRNDTIMIVCKKRFMIYRVC